MTCNRMVIMPGNNSGSGHAGEPSVIHEQQSQVLAEIAAPMDELRACWAEVPEIETYDVSACEGKHCAVLSPRAMAWTCALIMRERGWPLRELTRNRHSLEDLLRATDPAGRGGRALMQPYLILSPEMAPISSMTGYIIVATVTFLLGLAVVLLMKLQQESTYL
jgi:hypothetical protein